jgi:hypothetical protein
MPKEAGQRLASQINVYAGCMIRLLRDVKLIAMSILPFRRRGNGAHKPLTFRFLKTAAGREKSSKRAKVGKAESL